MGASIAAMTQVISHRKLGTIPYQASTTQSLRLDGDGVLQALNLRFQYTVTGGGSDAVGRRAFGLAAIAKHCELLVNSQKAIISTSGVHLAARQQIETGVRPYGMDATVVLTSAAVTVYDVIVRVPLTLPRAVAPWDTGLNMARVQQAVLSITWGTAADLFVTTNSAAISAVTCSVEGEYLVTSDKSGPEFVRELVHITQDVGATNADLGIMIDRGPYWLRSLNVLTVSDGLPVNTMLDAGGLSLKSGNIPIVNRDGEPIRADQAGRYGMALAERTDGVYRIELPNNGKNITNPNMGALASDMYLRANVTKVGTTDQLHVGIERISAHP